MANKIWKTTDEEIFKKWNEDLDPEKPVIGVFPDWRQTSEEVKIISLSNMATSCFS